MDFSSVEEHRSRDLIEYLDFGSRLSMDDKLKTFAIQQLGPGMSVLDVGCGTGDDVRAIADIVGRQGRVAGTDPNPAMIAEAMVRGTPDNAQFEVSPASALPYRDATFDAVRADRVFQHIREPDLAASELRRVTKPGGTALLLDQDWGSLMISGADPVVTRRVIGAFCEGLARPWAGREARGLLLKAGFAHVDYSATVSIPPFSTALVSVLIPAIETATAAGAIDGEGGRRWLDSLVKSEERGAFFCGVVVVIALGVSRTTAA